jgi:hypothetical protein
MNLPFIGGPMVPAIASAALASLRIVKAKGEFKDRYQKVNVYQVSNGLGFNAYVYMCRLNLDLDGAPTTYGYDNPAKDSVQKNLKPLESWHKGWKGVSNATSQKVGLGNAAGDPGDGSKGWQNFLNGNRIFYWVGIRSARKTDKLDSSVLLDDRAELEAGLRENAKNGKPVVVAKGQGWYPLVQKSTGYYISTTSVHADDSAMDSSHYLDSTVVPYAVWANHWDALGVSQGDFGLAIENATGANLAYVYGDSGTRDKVGECSQKIHDSLGKGAGHVTFIAFPGSGAGPKAALGAHPEILIPFKVLAKMSKLQKSKEELARHLAMGRDLGYPKLHVAAAQSPAVDTFLSALSAWATDI